MTNLDHEQTGYTIDASARSWSFGNPGSNVFDFDYTHGREQLLRLYDKGTRRQWVASDRIDWSAEISDFDNPLGAPDEGIALFGSPIWERMTERERGELRRHQVAWQFSNFLHGEQGALLCASKIVNSVPNIDAKFYAATQVIDEARHVEVFGRYLHEKLDLVYPLNTNLQSLLEDALSDYPLGHDLSRDAGPHRRTRAGCVCNHPQHGAGPARTGNQRIRHARRGTACDVRSTRTARLLPGTDRSRARRS